MSEIMKAWSQEMGPMLQHFIAFNRYRTCVEIGVAFGTTTLFLCRGAEANGGRVYGFDLWDIHGVENQFPQIGSQQDVTRYLNNNGVTNFELTKIDTKTEQFKDKIRTIGHIDFAFIDGCHTYDGIKNDFYTVYRQLSPCGAIVFHDTLRIDGCREFMIDLRTIYNDGTFDMIEMPWGNLDRRVGVTILMKRSFATLGIGVDEVLHGGASPTVNIYSKEQSWIKQEQQKHYKGLI